MTPEQISALPYRPCVGLMMINAEGKVFVGQRIDSKAQAWQMPQGGIDSGESPVEAAMRELGEETGVSSEKVTVLAESADWVPYDLPHDLVPKLWKGRFRGQKQKWFLLKFHGANSDIDITLHEQEFSEWQWMDVDALLGNIVPFKHEVYAKVIAEFHDLL
ncbi:MAG: RNA pyrophosphohydrolase [Litoreibacter sp.]